MLIIYRIFFPLIFLFFLPGLIWKLIRRGGWKKTFGERFGIFSADRKEELKEWQNAIWLHAVSVGETNLALTLLKEWNKNNPRHKFILSTTTTTGQEIARSKAPENTRVIFCPIDFYPCVCSTMNLLKPAGMVIFETELWPELIHCAKKSGAGMALVNTRISDKSFSGYYRWRFIFSRVLSAFDVICAQSQLDKERLLAIAPALDEALSVSGNIKFDQTPPAGDGFNFSDFFGAKSTVILAASTHTPEDELILAHYRLVHEKYPDTRLVIVPRHAERGGSIEKQINAAALSCFRRSTQTGAGHPDVLLADTTGELPGFIKGADIIIMGKTLAGNDEGQNIIEPAVMGKPVICGPKLKNFRQALDVLVKGNAVCRIEQDSALAGALEKLVADPELRFELGERARSVMLQNKGALKKSVDVLEKLFA